VSRRVEPGGSHAKPIIAVVGGVARRRPRAWQRLGALPGGIAGRPL